MQNASLIRLVFACALGAAIGCDGSVEPPIDPPPPDGQLVIGSSELSGVGFVSVDDGADVELVSGAQGGFHIWTTLRVRDAAGPLFLHREARLVSDGTLILKAQRLYVEVPEEAMDNWWEREDAAPSFMCPSPVGVKIFDTEIALTATLTDEDGEILAEDHKILIPRCPTGDLHDWCLNICSG